MKYRKKTEEIKAMQFVRHSKGAVEKIKAFCPTISITIPRSPHGIMTGKINTLDGVVDVTEGDYIVKGVKGNYYPCKPDIFEMTYELVEE